MSLLDTQRHPTPLIEECAKALHERRFDWPFATCGSRYRQARHQDVRAVIDVLRSRGFLTLDGLQAIKAEEAGETNGR